MARRVEGLAIVPAAFLVHNIEEAATIPAFLPRAQAAVASVLGPRAMLPSSAEYLALLAVLTAAAFLLWLLALRLDWLSYGLVVLQATLALNVLNHLWGAAALGGYAPGAITAVLVEAPVGVAVYRRLRRAGWMSRGQWALLPVLALLLHGPVLYGLLLVVGA